MSPVGPRAFSWVESARSPYVNFSFLPGSVHVILFECIRNTSKTMMSMALYHTWRFICCVMGLRPVMTALTFESETSTTAAEPDWKQPGLEPPYYRWHLVWTNRFLFSSVYHKGPRKTASCWLWIFWNVIVSERGIPLWYFGACCGRCRFHVPELPVANALLWFPWTDFWEIQFSTRNQVIFQRIRTRLSGN